ncbi:phage holin [Oceanobacillus sp. J11TS1]|uniref:phage holin n=1 Tax=Oceanobacillus sp. J11TS1 TaxID=2807191 RepID=UPI001B1A08A3|nr:phage holin [Oceanobacillus sp. J11TS1]GIO22419.1 hypothetical protein J11TS1_10000 [Oceanobacillus sp. J11TS1]
MQQAIIRLGVLLILFVNQALVLFGWSPLPFSEDMLYEAGSYIATVGAAIYTWWKNNNITEEAQEVDRILKDAKQNKKVKFK